MKLDITLLCLGGRERDCLCRKACEAREIGGAIAASAQRIDPWVAIVTETLDLAVEFVEKPQVGTLTFIR